MGHPSSVVDDARGPGMIPAEAALDGGKRDRGRVGEVRYQAQEAGLDGRSERNAKPSALG